jgi:hypothetical protein
MMGDNILNLGNPFELSSLVVIIVNNTLSIDNSTLNFE